MLLDAIVGAPARRPFPSESPAELVNGDLVLALVLGAGQLERRGKRRAAPADHGDLDGARRRHALRAPMLAQGTACFDDHASLTGPP